MPQCEPLYLAKVYVSDRPVRLVSDEHFDELHADPSFMAGQCGTKLLLLTPALVDDQVWQKEEKRLIVNARHRYQAKSRGLSFKELSDTRLR